MNIIKKEKKKKVPESTTYQNSMEHSKGSHTGNVYTHEHIY
jgi:hypothetical protein